MNAVEIVRAAEYDLDHNRINLGEFEKRLEPLHDVEPVVRCKNCVHGYISEFDVNKEIWCCGYNHILSTVKPDFYCADGVRK